MGGGDGQGAGAGGRGVNLSDPAALGAVTLALGLLHSRLKAEATARGGKRAGAMDRKGLEVRAMADPFVPLLTRCEDEEVGGGGQGSRNKLTMWWLVVQM